MPCKNNKQKVPKRYGKQPYNEEDYVVPKNVQDILDRKDKVTLSTYSMIHGAKLHATVDGLHVVGGTNCTTQDAVSLDLAPKNAAGENVKIERFQVRHKYRKKGYGRRVMNELIRIYSKAKALSLSVPAPTSDGIKFYKKCGFTRDKVAGDLVFLLQMKKPAEGTTTTITTYTHRHSPTNRNTHIHTPTTTTYYYYHT